MIFLAQVIFALWTPNWSTGSSETFFLKLIWCWSNVDLSMWIPALMCHLIIYCGNCSIVRVESLTNQIHGCTSVLQRLLRLSSVQNDQTFLTFTTPFKPQYKFHSRSRQLAECYKLFTYKYFKIISAYNRLWYFDIRFNPEAKNKSSLNIVLTSWLCQRNFNYFYSPRHRLGQQN